MLHNWPSRALFRGGLLSGRDEFAVLTGLAPWFATALFDGDVVDYLESEAGERIIQSKHHDAAFGTVEWLAVDPTNIKRGWQLCDSTNGTADLRDRIVVGNRGGDRKPSKGRNGEVGDYAAVGDAGGYRGGHSRRR